MRNYIKKLKAINKKYEFYKIPKKYIIQMNVNSKKQLDNFNFDKKLLAELGEDTEHSFLIQDYIKAVKYNRKFCYEYDVECDANYDELLQEIKKIKISFRKLKLKLLIIPLYKCYRKSPSLDFDVKVHAIYISPAKKVRREREKTYGYTRFIDLYNSTIEIPKHKNNKSDNPTGLRRGSLKLRLLVLQRDEFKCVLCCESSKKGVKLEVYPVNNYSVGDKIEDFQTVCTSCANMDLGYVHPLPLRKKLVIEDYNMSYKQYKHKYLLEDDTECDRQKQIKQKQKEKIKQRELIDKIRKTGGIDESGIEREAKDTWKYLERSYLDESEKDRIKQMDNYTCQFCGRGEYDNTTLAVDHIYPVAKGGKSELVNLQTLCWECNTGKRDRILLFNKYNIDENNH